MNSKMVNCEMVVLTGRERRLIWVILMCLWARCCSLLLERWWTKERKKADVVWMRLRYSLTITGTSLTGRRWLHHPLELGTQIKPLSLVSFRDYSIDIVWKPNLTGFNENCETRKSDWFLVQNSNFKSGGDENRMIFRFTDGFSTNFYLNFKF
jgi:hypothetical protein